MTGEPQPPQGAARPGHGNELRRCPQPAPPAAAHLAAAAALPTCGRQPWWPPVRQRSRDTLQRDRKRIGLVEPLHKRRSHLAVPWQVGPGGWCLLGLPQCWLQRSFLPLAVSAFTVFCLQQLGFINVGLDTVKMGCCATLGARSGYRPHLQVEGDVGIM